MAGLWAGGWWASSAAMQAPAKNSHRGHSRKMPRFGGEGVPATPNMHRGYKRSGYDFASGVTNHLYTPMVVTNATGTVVERYAYTAYGQRSIVGSSSMVSAVGNSGGFTGYQIDGETGLCYARARMYLPVQGRFIVRDPFVYIDGLSTYTAYFSPNSLDPTGTAEGIPPAPPKDDTPKPGTKPPRPLRGPGDDHLNDQFFEWADFEECRKGDTMEQYTYRSCSTLRTFYFMCPPYSKTMYVSGLEKTTHYYECVQKFGGRGTWMRKVKSDTGPCNPG